MRHGNEILRIPDASAKGTVDGCSDRCTTPPAATRKPRLFDGSPRRAADLRRAGGHRGPPRALVGQSIDVHGEPATVALPPRPAATSVSSARPARTRCGCSPPRRCRWPGSSAPTGGPSSCSPRSSRRPTTPRRLADCSAPPPPRRSGSTSSGPGSRRSRGCHGRLASGAPPSRLLVLYAADAADRALDRGRTEALRKVLRFGPEVGVHVLGWWRSPAAAQVAAPDGRLARRPGLVGRPRRPGLRARHPGAGPAPVWSPRPGRGLFFDRARHAPTGGRHRPGRRRQEHG